jgi:hypothetical protein
MWEGWVKVDPTAPCLRSVQSYLVLAPLVVLSSLKNRNRICKEQAILENYFVSFSMKSQVKYLNLNNH